VPAADEMWRRRLRAEEHALQIDAKDQIPVLAGHRGERAITRDASVVDQNVDLFVLGGDPVDRLPGLLLIGYVRLITKRLAAGAPDFLDGLIYPRLIAGHDGDNRAFLGEAIGDGAADAGVGARYDGHFVLQPHRRPPPSRLFLLSFASRLRPARNE